MIYLLPVHIIFYGAREKSERWVRRRMKMEVERKKEEGL